MGQSRVGVRCPFRGLVAIGLHPIPHRVLGVLRRVLEVHHRVLGVLHRVLGVLHRVLGVLHRVLGVGSMSGLPPVGWGGRGAGVLTLIPTISGCVCVYLV